MKTHRICVPLPDEHKISLKKFQNTMIDQATKFKYIPADMDEAYMTLSVCRLSEERKKKKETDAQVIGTINKLLETFLMQDKEDLYVSFGGLSSFGARVVFITMKVDDRLEDLRYDINEDLENEGIEITDTRFQPRLTLFRAGESEPKLEPVRAWLQDLKPPVLASFPVTQLHFRKIMHAIR